MGVSEYPKLLFRFLFLVSFTFSGTSGTVFAMASTISSRHFLIVSSSNMQDMRDSSTEIESRNISDISDIDDVASSIPSYIVKSTRVDSREFNMGGTSSYPLKDSIIAR